MGCHYTDRDAPNPAREHQPQSARAVPVEVGAFKHRPVESNQGGEKSVTTPAGSASARFKARLAGVFYSITFLAGGFALFDRSGLGIAAGVIAGLSYVAVTLILYVIFKPVSRSLSLLAALVSLVGCGIEPVSLVVKLPGQPNDLSLVFFGLYCLLIGYLIFRSTFLPRVVGGLMVFAGLGWLTFLSPSLARDLFPYVLAPGIIGEGSLTLWLLLFGVDAQKWTELANAR